MRKLLLITTFFTPLFSLSQKTNFYLTVTFKCIVPAKHVYVFMNDERRIDTLNYTLNDTLFYNGVINKTGTFQIATDSSASEYVWVDSNPTSFILSEKRTTRGNIVLKISTLEGSDDAKLFFLMGQPRVIGPPTFYPASLTKEQRD